MCLEAIIMPTYNKNEKYIDYCVKAIDIFWPSHPSVWVLSDRGSYKHKNSVVIKSPHWVEVLEKGTEELLNKNILHKDDYILLLHEDHAPFETVPEKLILSVTHYARDNALKFISLSGHGFSKKVAEIEGVGLFRIKDDFPTYSEHHPAIWNIGHLINIMKKSMFLNSMDAWASELVRDPDVVHYTLGEYNPGRYIWPSLFGGFLRWGKVNIKTVEKIRSKDLTSFKRVLAIDCAIGWFEDLPRRILYKIKRREWIMIKDGRKIARELYRIVRTFF